MMLFTALVAASSVVCLAAAFVKGGAPILGLALDPGLIGVAAAGAALAVATWRAAAISAFLRIFSVVFAVEFACVAVALAAAQLDLWPAALADIRPPASLPGTLASAGGHRTTRSSSAAKDRAQWNWPDACRQVWPAPPTFHKSASHGRGLGPSVAIAAAEAIEASIEAAQRWMVCHRGPAGTAMQRS